MTSQRRRQQPDAERGAIGVFLVVLVPGLLLIIGLAFDEEDADRAALGVRLLTASLAGHRSR